MRFAQRLFCPHPFGKFQAQALVRLRKRVAGFRKARPRAFKAAGCASDLFLKPVEIQCHVADLVARMDDDRREIEVRLGGFEITRGERAHRAGEIGERPFDQVFRRLRNFDRRLRDRSRQNQADADRQ